MGERKDKREQEREQANNSEKGVATRETHDTGAVFSRDHLTGHTGRSPTIPPRRFDSSRGRGRAYTRPPSAIANLPSPPRWPPPQTNTDTSPLAPTPLPPLRPPHQPDGQTHLDSRPRGRIDGRRVKGSQEGTQRRGGVPRGAAITTAAADTAVNAATMGGHSGEGERLPSNGRSAGKCWIPLPPPPPCHASCGSRRVRSSAGGPPHNRLREEREGARGNQDATPLQVGSRRRQTATAGVAPAADGDSRRARCGWRRFPAAGAGQNRDRGRDAWRRTVPSARAVWPAAAARSSRSPYPSPSGSHCSGAGAVWGARLCLSSEANPLHRRCAWRARKGSGTGIKTSNFSVTKPYNFCLLFAE